MRMFTLTLVLLLLAAGGVSGYDPLYYDNLTNVLTSTQAGGSVAIGYFGAGQYWRSDSLGNNELYDYETSLGVLRVLAAGRYGLTSSHTISIILPAYFKLQGEGDSTGVGIADPWVSVDAWISRSPHLLARGAIRVPLKGALESGDYSESDRHLALDGALTIETPLGQGSGATVQATGGIRYSFWAWDGLYAVPRDSAETRPPVEFRLTGFVRYPVNPELSIRLGGDIATRGETEAQLSTGTESQLGSSFSQYDLRAGFELSNSSIDLTAEVFYRLGGGNTDKEWGIMIDGTGIDILDLFGGSSSGGR